MCTGCNSAKKRRVSPQRKIEMAKETPQPLIAPKSDDPNLVHLRYYGGGLTRQTTGCSSCGSQGKYALTTSETIQFASDDAPMGWFSRVFTVPQDYWVTQKQAERLLQETFTNPAGQVIHKFKVIEQVALLQYNESMKSFIGAIQLILIIIAMFYLKDTHVWWNIAFAFTMVAGLCWAFGVEKGKKDGEQSE